MDNADLRQIMEKTDMAQAAQHQEEQRHGQLQLEMQVDFDVFISSSLPPLSLFHPSFLLLVPLIILTTLSPSLPPLLPPSLPLGTGQHGPR